MSDETVTCESLPPGERGVRVMPTAVGRYRPVRMLGEGGMGVVYAAWDPSLEREMAIKLMRPQIGDPEHVKAARERSLREARALANLAHPNVVEVFDCGTHEGRVYLALQVVTGGSLADWLENHPTAPWDEVIDLFVKAGRGVAAAHDQGIIHRDFKAANVLVDLDGRVRITDFGIARVQDVSHEAPTPTPLGYSGTDGEPLTEAGAVVGTRGYIPPELFRGKRADGRSDQFSFCVALYAALYSARPYSSHAFDSASHNETGPRVPQDDRGVPKEIQAALIRGLSVDPQDRFVTMVALLDVLAPPTARRARLWWTVAGLLLGTIALWSVYDPNPQGCRSEDPQLAAMWSPAVRGQLAADFSATERLFADGAWKNVEGRIERWVDSWKSVRAEVCNAPRDLAFDRRLECLAVQRADLHALLQALDTPSLASVARAPIAAAELPDPTHCGQVESDTPLYVPEAALAITFAEHGRFAAAREAAAGATADAHDRANPAEIAAASVATGRVHELAGEYARAESTLSEAYWTASAADDERSMAAAATGLVRVVGVRQRRHTDAAEWIRHANAAFDRGIADPVTRVELARATAAVDLAGGRLADSVVGYEQALALSRELLPDLALRAADIQASLGNALWRVRRMGDARKQLDDSLAIYQAELGASHPAQATALEYLAHVLSDTGDLETAESHFEEVLALRRSVLGNEHPAVATTLNNIAGIAHKRGDLARARSLLMQTLEIRRSALKHDHPDFAAALNNLARVDAELGDYDAAAAGFREVLSILEPIWRADHPRLAQPLVGLGTALLQARRPNDAVKPLERALAILETSDSEPAAINGARRALGFALWKLGLDRDRAAGLLRAARDRAVDAGIRDGLTQWLRERDLDSP